MVWKRRTKGGRLKKNREVKDTGTTRTVDMVSSRQEHIFWLKGEGVSDSREETSHKRGQRTQTVRLEGSQTGRRVKAVQVRRGGGEKMSSGAVAPSRKVMFATVRACQAILLSLPPLSSISHCRWLLSLYVCYYRGHIQSVLSIKLSTSLSISRFLGTQICVQYIFYFLFILFLVAGISLESISMRHI